MDHVHTLIVGAGATGLAYANFTSQPNLLILEADAEIGGYCKTIHQDGFVWDYSGHFFHFRYPEIREYLVSRMPPDEVSHIVKRSKIRFGDAMIEFPFQKNIHQLPKADFIDCLYELYFRPSGPTASFKDMLVAKFGQGICDRFLFPYNEKLYATDLATLDVDAMGRFFPYADLDEIIRNFKEPDNRSYNATFSYPRGGAFQYIQALASEIPPDRIALEEPLVAIDLERKIATTPHREIAFEVLVSSAPFDRLLAMTSLEVPQGIFTSNKVLVFNLGFDQKGWKDLHWTYFPDREVSFYRVGWYDNIFNTDRMSLYVEIGLPTDAPVDLEGQLARVLDDLSRTGVVTNQSLISWHSVVLDPAYVHITGESMEATRRLRQVLASHGVHSIGRYGGWTYCSIEDNLIEARQLVETLEGRVVER